MWKVTFAALGAVLGIVVGCFAVYLFPQGGGPHGELPSFGQLALVPAGGIIFCLLGLYLGSVLDGQPLVLRTGDNAAAQDEELESLVKRGEIVKVRVELTSYVNHDAIRGDLERTGFLETDERTLLQRVLSCGSVKWITGTIHAARIQELAALSFVKSVERKGS